MLYAAATLARSDGDRDWQRRAISQPAGANHRAVPAGAPPDIIARILGNKLAEQLGQPVIVDPRPGASGVIAAEIAKNAAPDGYTLLLAGSTLFAMLPALKPKLPYDPDKDFVALSRVASVALAVAVHPSLGAGTVADLVKLAKARPASSTTDRPATARRHISQARCSTYWQA